METKNEIKAEFTQFNNDSNWCNGKVGPYNFEAKLFDEGSDFGIKKGRVSKLYVTSKTEGYVIGFDRGWDKNPTKENRPYFNAIMELLENSPKRFEGVEGE